MFEKAADQDGGTFLSRGGKIMKSASVAIMQPYIFPYLGYYQLVHAADHFVFYDDVQYMKGGWVNRNRITNQGTAHVFTVPIQGASANSLIKDTFCEVNDRFLKKFMRQIEQEYGKAPYFRASFDILNDVFRGNHQCSVSKIAVESVMQVFGYLGLSLKEIMSSRDCPRQLGVKGTQRVIDITKMMQGAQYINLPGGVELYSEELFDEADIELKFIKNRSPAYKQTGSEYVPNLSIIDIMMHNSPERIREMLTEYELLTRSQMAAEG